MAKLAGLLMTLTLLLLPISSSSSPHISPRSPLQTPWKSTCSATSPIEQAYTGGGRLPETNRWHGPHDCHGAFCIFATRALSKHAWTVLATPPEASAALAAYFPDLLASAARSPSVVAPPPFTVVDLPGKGRGLVANRTIRAGEQIIAEDAILIIHAGAHLPTTPADETARVYDLILSNLPRAARAEFLAQVGDDALAIMHRNGFQIPAANAGTDDEPTYAGAFPQQALINHDCRPNLAYHFRGATHISTAVRDIAAGEELTNSYIDVTLPHAQRQALLSARYGFTCACSLCARPPDEIAASDARLARVAELQEALDKPAVSFPAGRLDRLAGEELVGLYTVERLDMLLGFAWRRAAYNYALFGDEEGARRCAGMAVRMLEWMGVVGPARQRDVVNMRALVADPRGHWSWGLLVSWTKLEAEKEKGFLKMPAAHI